MSDTSGPFIIWEDYGYEGWQPKSYQSLTEALMAQRYSSTFVVTEKIDIDVTKRLRAD